MDLFESKKVLLLKVSPEEALDLIRSLTTQMIVRSPNSGRLETYLKDGRNFSIAVVEDLQ